MPLAWFQLHITETIQNNNYTLSHKTSWGVHSPSNHACSSLTIMWLTHICMDGEISSATDQMTFLSLLKPSSTPAEPVENSSLQTGIWINSRKDKGLHESSENTQVLCALLYYLYFILPLLFYTWTVPLYSVLFKFTLWSMAPQDEQCPNWTQAALLLHISDSSSSSATFLCHLVLQHLQQDSTLILKRSIEGQQEDDFEVGLYKAWFPLPCIAYSHFKKPKGSGCSVAPSPHQSWLHAMMDSVSPQTFLVMKNRQTVNQCLAWGETILVRFCSLHHLFMKQTCTAFP